MLVGLTIAWLLAALGLTETDTVLLGSWLAGLGLMGGWQQVVTSDVAGGLEWSTWAAGAPLLITGFGGRKWWRHLIRRMRVGLAGVAGAALGAGGAAAVLVTLSQRTLTTTNEAGRVDVSEGLTWWWTGGPRPGTVTGAVALAVLVGLVTTVAGRPVVARGPSRGVRRCRRPGVADHADRRGGRRVRFRAQRLWATALAVLYPLLGSATLLAVGGAPRRGRAHAVTPEPYVLSTWSSGLLVGTRGRAWVRTCFSKPSSGWCCGCAGTVGRWLPGSPRRRPWPPSSPGR